MNLRGPLRRSVGHPLCAVLLSLPFLVAGCASTGLGDGTLEGATEPAEGVADGTQDGTAEGGAGSGSRSEGPIERTILDEPFTLAPGEPGRIAFEVPAASESTLRVVLSDGAVLRIALHGPGACDTVHPRGEGVAPGILVRAGHGNQWECGPLDAGSSLIEWEGEGYLSGRIVFTVWS